MSSTALVARATIEDIVAGRDRTVELFDAAIERIREADAAVKAANEMLERTAPRSVNSFTYDRIQEIDDFTNAVKLPDIDQYRRVARKITDLRCWGHIVSITDLERLMDLEEKQKLRNQMRYEPDRVSRRRPRFDHDDAGQLIDEAEVARGMPPLTVDNIYATLDRFRSDAAMIFRRGIVNVFSKLDRRFRSHDGFKIGSRIILSYVFDRDGHFSWGSMRDKLIDIERVFAVLDGRPEDSFQSALDAIQRSRQGTSNARQSEAETEYFIIRGFKNGNAHLWLRRDDLVEKVNKLLAEYYGEVIGDADLKAEDPLERRAMTPAKSFGFYPTPPEAVDCLFGERRAGSINVLQDINKPPLRILEPSAGTGNLARRCVQTADGKADWYLEPFRFDNIVDVIEVQPALASGLLQEGIYNRVICADFLTIKPEALSPYDIIVMNPPFDWERDIDHVSHAFKFLKPGGTLHAIMSAGTEFRETRKAAAFRNLVADHRGRFEDMPAGSFAEVGTYVNTVVLTITKRTTP